MTRDCNEPVVIIGAGPAGLAVAALLKQQEIAFLLVDKKGIAGGAYNEIYADMRMASPAKYTSLPGYPLAHEREYVTVGAYRDYLHAYARHFDIRPQKATVQRVTANGGCFEIRLDAGRASVLKASHVVLASGMFDNPVWPDDVNIEHKEGEGSTESAENTESNPDCIQVATSPRIMHAHDWQGVQGWLNKKVLIIGSATSAVEIAEEFARHGSKVIVSSHAARVKSIPQRLLGRDVHDFLVPLAYLPNWMLRHYCRQINTETDPATHTEFKVYRRQHLIDLVGDCRRIANGRADFKDGSSAIFDLIIVATGYRFDYSYLSLGESPQQVLRTFVKGESRRWPGLYIMGNGCVFGKPSQFLWGIAYDAPLLAAKIAKSLNRANA